MEFNIETTRNCVKYGSIVSFMNDFPGNNETPTLTYDPTDPHSFTYNRKEDNVKYLESRNFLYSHGVFNEFCYLYPFKDIKKYYFNTLFLILPSCEYDSMLKFKYLIKRLKNEILMEDNPSINSSQIEDFFIKFKQEIEANHKESVKLMNNKINFGDCVQFLHIRSGKFLSFKKHEEYLKTYIELTEKMSKNTIFRFTPAFQYQERNSTNVYFQLTLRIACGEKRTKNEKYEKYVSNIKSHEEGKTSLNENKALKFGKQLIHSLNRAARPSLAIERVKSIKISLKNIFPDGNSKSKNLKDNLLTYSANSNLAYKNFGKKLLPEDNYIGVDRNKEDYWKLIKFSKDYINDNDFVNSLDYFCIQNIEKNIFINSVHTNKGESDNNDVNLFMRRNNEEMKNKNMNNGIKENDNISQKLIDEKDKIPKLVSGNFDLIVEENINDMKMKDKNTERVGNIKLDYFYDEGFYSNKNSDLKIGYYKEKDYIEPLGLFKLEIVNNNITEKNLNKKINLVSTDTYIRLINVFSNKVVSVSTLKNNKNNSYKLTLIDNIDKNNEDYDRTLFKMEPIEELREALKNQDENNEEKDDEEKDEDENEENEDLIPENNKDNKDEDQDDDDTDDNIFVYKTDFVKIRSKKVNEYIGIRLNNNETNNVELVLTNSLSDLTKFRLNFLDEEDKYELHFFEQLLWSLGHVLTYFKQEKENVIPENNESNYENIQHILITLENKIKIFKNNRNVKIFQENKFDFLKIIKHFNIVSKLIDLFIANWFHDCKNIDYDKFEAILVKYFKEKKEELKCKQIISRKILKILTIIYDLEKSYLKTISDRLLYFFMFVGRDDKCTKFLVHILKNNRELLISLCPTYMKKKNSRESKRNKSSDEDDNNSSDSENRTSPTPEVYRNMKKCLKRIIRDYNYLDIVKLTIYFSSIFLFFKLMNCLLIYNDKPFKQFYDYYFEELNILKDEGDNYHKPDFENNPILVDFYLKDGMIYTRKAKFFKSEGAIIEENYSENEEDESETNKITSTNKIQTGSSRNNISNIGYFEFKLIDLIGINNANNIDKYKKILYAKLVSLNLFFYSNLSLCDRKFKDYLKTLFNINDVLSCYITLNKADSQYQKEKLNNNLNNDLKCSLMQLLNYLYFRVRFPFWEKINLFKYFEQSQFQRTKTDLDNIITYVNEIITNNINTNILKNDPFLLLQIFECTKYTLRNLYNLKNNPEWTDLAIDLMSKILKLLDKYIGISKTEKANSNLAESLQKVLKIQLDLKDPLFLVTDKFQFLFEKLRKKLESIIRNKEVKSLKKLFKELFGTAVAKENKSYISDTISRNLKNKSLNKLKKYNLSHILLEISINSNKEHKTIINEIMFMMTEIFLEFLQYTESLSIEEVGMKLFELKKVYNGNSRDFERFVIEEIIKKDNNIQNYSSEMIIHRYYEYKEQVENKYIEKLKKTWKNGDISSFFLKFLKIIDNVELKNLTLKIIYRLNNQQKIYYENISNYVVFYNQTDFDKFIEIKKLFLKMFNKIRNINLIQRLDTSTFKLYKKLNKLFNKLIKNLFNEKKWRQENKVLINYEEIEFYDEANEEINNIEDSESSGKSNDSDSDSNSDSDSKSDSESNSDSDSNSFNSNSNSDSKINKKSRSKSKSKSNKSNSQRKLDTDKEVEYPIVKLKDNEEIIDTTVKKKETLKRKSKENPLKKKKTKKTYYLDDKYDENNNINLLIIQQTLYNLGFISLINEFLEYIEYEVVNKEELKELEGDLKYIEDILISIYKLLVLFIYNNNKHQTLIKDKLYLYICPLRLKKKSQLMLCYIGYFILNLVYNFESKNDLNQIRNLDNVINNLYKLHELDWFGCQEIIPIYVESFAIIIENAPTQYFSSLFQVLQDIIEVLKNKIENKTDTKNDLIALKKILQLIIAEQDKKTLEENKNTAIFPLEKIIYVFLNMINLLKSTKKIIDMKYLKLCKIFVLTTNLLYNNFNLYKNDFEGTKRHYRNLKKILKEFCDGIDITDRLIYAKNKNDEFELKDFNKFIGLSIPKLCIILQIAGEKNNMDKDSDIEFILNTINKFYHLIVIKIESIKKTDPLNIFLSLKDKEEVEEILKNIGNNSLNYMEEVLDQLKKVPKLSLIDSKPTMTIRKSDQFANYIDGEKLKFNEMWNKIQLEINYNKDHEKFQGIVKLEINKERKKFVKIFFENSKNINNDEDLMLNFSYYNTYCESYKNFYGKDFINYKNELYFFYWSKIFLLEYDKERKEDFLNNKIVEKYKEFFKNLDIIDFTIEQFGNINVFSNNYEHLLFIKFFNSYLNKLDDKTKSECFMKFIDKPEAENIFALLKYILDELQKEINLSIKENKKQSDQMEPGNKIDQANNKNYHYSSHLFENDLNEYNLVLQFIMNLSENNEIIKGKMKDYLRIQYNNSKNNNFIVILGGIIESFISEENPNSILLIPDYFSTIIKIIECITKCCNGSSKENQDCVVKETQMLKFTKFIFEKLAYRPKKYYDTGISSSFGRSNRVRTKEKLSSRNSYSEINKTFNECSSKLGRKRLAYLKFKLLQFLNVLTVKREKDDKIYELIHQVIDFNTLINLLVETYKEILIEKNCQDNPDSLILDENMLSRMDSPEYKDLDKWEDMSDDHFIIFEIGTFSFILINIYLEHLTRPMDNDIYDKIIEIRKQLKKNKCEEVKKSIFDIFVNAKEFFKCLGRCFIIDNCSKKVHREEDFKLYNGFIRSYSFFFDYTPDIEIIFNNQIIKYYVKLSPICKCLTDEMKEEFHSNLDRSSTRSKLESLFENIESFQYQLNNTKKRLDIFQKWPILDLFLNQYKFYRDLFLIITAFLNILLFASFYRTTDDNSSEPILEYSTDFTYDYGFLYKADNIKTTKQIFFYMSLILMIISFLILVDYIIIRMPSFTYYKKCIFKYDGNDDIKVNKEQSDNSSKNGRLKHITSIVINIFKDIKLLYHAIVFIFCIITFASTNYRFLVILLMDVVERSETLMYIVKSILLPIKQIVFTLFLFYLVAYYFSILVYLFIPDQLPTQDCLKFSDCFFTMCDQTIKNSNGIINYLVEDGLYTTHTLWSNVRFWIDNWFAIIDTMLVLQIVAAIIIDTFISQREESKKIEKDKKNKCFICGLKKNELNKYYHQVNEHIKLDHYLWNYMFVIFNIMQKDSKNLISIDQIIYESYKNKIYSTWIPYKKCKIKIEEDKKEENSKKENEDKDKDN